MTTCPKCGNEHRGPRDLEQLHHELSRAVERASQLNMVEARSHLRVHTLRIWTELSDFCANCTLNAQGDVAGAVSFESIAAVREADETLQAVSGGADIIPITRAPRAVADFYTSVQQAEPHWMERGHDNGEPTKGGA